MNEFYSIGDVARRTGLSVSAIRYYSDAGIIAPSGHTVAGYRIYDIRAVASLELVRTLRELGAGLDDIRQLLADETTLHDLAAAHLTLVERQLHRLQARQAVLRTVVRQHSVTEQVSLMHKLVSMSDDDRGRLIDEFWTEVTEGLAARSFVDGLRRRRPELPEEPSCEQLEAWIELADMVQDGDFRQSVRQFLHETLATPAVASERGSLTEAEAAQQVAMLQEARAAYEAGLPVDSPQAGELARRFVASIAAFSGDQGTAEVRRQIIEASPRASDHVARYAELLGRYNSLVATINGEPQAEKDRRRAATAPASTWLYAAVEALGS